MNARYDMLVFDRLGQPVAIVEVKGRRDLSPQSAAAVARYLWDMWGTDVPLSVRYFLLITPSRGYLWHVENTRGHWECPLSFSMQDVVDRYGRLSDVPEVTKLSLTYLVDRWLSDLTVGRNGHRSEAELLLESEGLVDAVSGGVVRIYGESS